PRRPAGPPRGHRRDRPLLQADLGPHPGAHAPRHGQVSASFTVAEGTVKSSLRGSAGTAAEVTVTPEAPGHMETNLRLNRNDSSFRFNFEPEGEVVGLRGEVSYKAT